jgi:hypothetical protein
MTTPPSRLLALAILTAAAAGCGDAGKPTEPREAAMPDPTIDSTSDTMETELEEIYAAPAGDLRAMRDQFARIEMNPDTSFLSDNEREVVNLLIDAAEMMNEIYLRQLSEDNPDWRAEIASGDLSQRDQLLDLFDLHFGVWDSLDHNKPFYRSEERPAGAGFYPGDIDKSEFEAWLEDNPDDEDAFTSPYTVIRRTEEGGLIAVPYSTAYARWLEPAAEKLREAAALTENQSLKRFLELRAESFLTDDYYQSEMAWMDLEGPIEIAIGPYEVYDDGLFGMKTAFEAFVTVKNPEESAALDKYKGMLRDMEENLPVPDEYKNFKRGFESPIAVVDQVHGGGDNVPGVQTIAFNLPNDERVREAKGAKKVLLNNVMGAKFDRILAPLAGRVLVEEQADLLMQKYMGVNTLFHELSHSLGPGTITVDGEETTVNAQLKERYSALEEGKADVMGAYNILYMMERGELPATEKENFLATYFAGLFRSMRFGIGEAHGKGAAFQYSFYKEAGAFEIDEDTGLIRVDFDTLEKAIRELTAKVVMIQGDGDYEGAGEFLDGYGVLDAEAERIIVSMEGIPVDIQPVYPSQI